MVLKTTFGQSQRWSLIRCRLGVENDEKNNFNFANKVLNRYEVLILGGLTSGISLYYYHECNVFKVNSAYHIIFLFGYNMVV